MGWEVDVNGNAWQYAYFEGERDMLRTELQHLKNCQVTFLTFAVTATGILLGLSKVFVEPAPENMSALGSGVLFLAPLMIVIPFWWAFFDKAATITRIVGYVRVLEQFLTRHVDKLDTPGWESSLRIHRDFGSTLYAGHCPTKKEVVGLVLLREHNRYWMVAFYTFLCLCLVCLCSAYIRLSNIGSLSLWDMRSWTGIEILFTGCAALVLGSLFGNLRRVFGLLWGELSYNAQEKKWNLCLKVDPHTIQVDDVKRDLGFWERMTRCLK